MLPLGGSFRWHGRSQAQHLGQGRGVTAQRRTVDRFVVVADVHRVADFDYETHGPVQFTGDVLGPVTAAKGGAGLIQTYRFIVEQDLASGSLKQVLQNYAGASRPFSILYPSSRHIPRRVRVLIDFLLLQLRSANGRKSAARAVPGSLRVGARAKRKS